MRNGKRRIEYKIMRVTSDGLLKEPMKDGYRGETQMFFYTHSTIEAAQKAIEVEDTTLDMVILPVSVWNIE